LHRFVDLSEEHVKLKMSSSKSSYCHGFNGSEGAGPGPKCRHGWKPGVNLKDLFYKEKNKNHSNAGEKLET